jgi:hypothetical protein
MLFWKELLMASGGKLELPKCFYFVLTWKFDSKGHPYSMTITEQQTIVNQIQIFDPSLNTIIPILQKEGHLTLGCYKSTNGSQDDEMQYLQYISNNLGRSIKNRPLTWKQTRFALNTVRFPSLTYLGLTSTSLTFNQLIPIQCYAIKKFFSGMGYGRSTPRSLIYGPEEFSGFGVRYLYTKM